MSKSKVRFLQTDKAKVMKMLKFADYKYSIIEKVNPKGNKTYLIRRENMLNITYDFISIFIILSASVILYKYHIRLTHLLVFIVLIIILRFILMVYLSDTYYDKEAVNEFPNLSGVHFFECYSYKQANLMINNFLEYDSLDKKAGKPMR